ncbi:MAG: transposase [Eggerthellaceae bacterium]|nr:transposase [Eggerthellaceae bacterium]
MARSIRKQSESGIYHVMLRGISHAELFYDDADRQAFLDRLKRFKADGGFELFAYALMGNHVHLLIQEKSEALSLSIKRLAVSYSAYFNAKYDRSGHLFEGRFKSEPVDSDAYLLTVLRYIHQNPLKVGKKVDFWTSYKGYLSPSGLVDSGFVLDMLSSDEAEARAQFKKLVKEPVDEGLGILGKEAPGRFTEEQAIEEIKRVCGIKSCNMLADFDRPKKESLLCSLKSAGLTVRQISRLTGIDRGLVQRAQSK